MILYTFIQNWFNKFYLDNIYFAVPTYKDYIGKINECEIMVHFFQEFNDEHKQASEFREIINLEWGVDYDCF